MVAANLFHVVDFDSYFLDSFTCYNGEKAPTFNNGLSWDDLANAFAGLPSATRALYQSGDSSVQSVIARYDQMVENYGYSNFMGRALAANASMNRLSINQNPKTIWVIVGIGAAALASFAALFIVRGKKKEN